jgi:hypothetical protein
MGARPVPVNPGGKRVVNGWDFHYMKWNSPDQASDTPNFKSRSGGATSTNPFPDNRKGQLDYELLKKMKLTKKRIVEGEALFFLQLPAGAAADVAVAAKELGISFVLRECNVANDMQHMLFPKCIESMFKDSNVTGNIVKGLRASTSAMSLLSMGDDTTASDGNTAATDSKRRKVTYSCSYQSSKGHKTSGDQSYIGCTPCYLLGMYQPNIAPAIPAVVNAILKPLETNKAIEELM